LLGRIQDYIHHHFDDEEAFMKMIGYPDIEGHKRNHKVFDEMIQVFENELILRGEVDIRILDFAEKWIVNHINKEVLEFREILSKRREEENVQTKIRSETDRRQGRDRRSGDKESLSDAT
jgi:hemerythrin